MKISTILCPIDFSTHNQEANEYASVLASSTGAKIIYLHITTPEAPYGDFGNVDPSEMMAKDLKNLKGYQPTVAGVKASWEVDFGPASQRIVEFANDHSVSLIVIGTHGRTGLRRVLMGSVAESVIRQAKCPVLAIKSLMPEKETACVNAEFVDEFGGQKMKSNTRSALTTNVACAIDVYDYDQQVIDLAATYAKQFGTALDLIYVTTAADFRSGLWPKPVGSAPQLITNNRRLEACATTVEGVLVHKHHLSGLPDKAIIEFAGEHAPCLLMLGTQDTTGLAKIFGSVATHVMRHVQCPVMVLRQHQNHKTSNKIAVQEVKS